jgi:PAS domain S-box-containing protein
VQGRGSSPCGAATTAMFSASGPVSSDAGSVRFKRLRLGIVVIGALIILAFDGSSAYDAWRSHRYSIDATNRELANVANALSEQTSWALQAVDLLLLDTARWYRSDRSVVPPERVNAVLENRTAGVQQVRRVLIIDAQGKPLYASRGSAPVDQNVSDRSYFIAQRDGAAQGLFMSEPLVTRSEGHAALIFSRRLDDEKGGFGGVVTAVVDLDNLKQFYESLNLGMGTAIQMMRTDGTLLARNPLAPDEIGRKFPAFVTVSSAPTPRLVNPIDGKSEFVAVAQVRNAPITIIVTRDEAIALSWWRDETIRVGVRTAILTLLGALTIWALLRQIRRVAAGERALRKSEERYALAMEGANEGHWDWDIPNERLFMSQKMKMLDGLSAESEITSRSVWLQQIVIHPDDRQRFETTFRDHFEGLTPWYDCEYRVRQPDGDWHWLHARGRCLRDSAGEPVRIVGSTIDVNAQKLAQAHKEQLEARLRQSQKMEAVGTLAGGIAHDFNNILGAILGYGELAHQLSAEGSPLRRYLDNVMHAAERARMLIERILGFSRSGLGDRAPVNVQFVIEETLELLGASLPAGIRLESRIESGNFAVIGDATYLHQVAMNLCTNALQAMEQGGTLRVILEPVEVNESRALSRGLLQPGSYVRFTVSDTGVGIAPAVLERIFDPFFTTKGVGQGTGLGLSLVHGIVSDLGGAIEVTSKAGEGTTFEIWLPVAGETAIPPLEAATPLPRGNGETVLIVDDERPLVALAEEITAQLGYEPVGFDSSRPALEAFSAQPQRFDAVLTDEAMPDLVGTEFAAEIRRLRPDIPIILMSGYGGAQLTNRVVEIGVNEVLRKPLHRRELAESLARVLASAH